ncbi:MAG: hypothetical protein ACJAUH_001450 [Saprospiraceae bacterium]|jgi:hypothetical protein
MKIVLVIFISLISLNLSAQDGNFKYISTGIKAGTEIGFMSLKSSERESKTALSLGYSIMIDFLEYRFNPTWSANIGVGFTHRNYRQIVDDVHSPDIFAKASGQENILVQNIEVPLTIRYYLTPENKFRHYYLTTGSTVYYNLHHNSKQEIFLSNGSTWEFNIQNDLKRTTFAATFGVGLELKTNYRLAYVLEAIGQFNFNQVPFEYGRDAKALGSIGLLVGVKF